ncbi:hypothetical protein Tco_0550830 [Tanacetum coccineum]
MSAVPPPSIYEVGGPSTATVKGPSFPHPTSGLLVPPSVIEDLSTRLGNLEYRHRQLVKKVIQVSGVEVAAGISIGEIGPRVFAIEGQEQVMASQMVHVADRFEQIGTQALAWAAAETERYTIQQLAGEETSRTSVVLLVELSYRGCKPDTDTEKRSS